METDTNAPVSGQSESAVEVPLTETLLPPTSLEVSLLTSIAAEAPVIVPVADETFDDHVHINIPPTDPLEHATPIEKLERRIQFLENAMHIRDRVAMRNIKVFTSLFDEFGRQMIRQSETMAASNAAFFNYASSSASASTSSGMGGNHHAYDMYDEDIGVSGNGHRRASYSTGQGGAGTGAPRRKRTNNPNAGRPRERVTTMSNQGTSRASNGTTGGNRNNMHRAPTATGSPRAAGGASAGMAAGTVNQNGPDGQEETVMELVPTNNMDDGDDLYYQTPARIASNPSSRSKKGLHPAYFGKTFLMTAIQNYDKLFSGWDLVTYPQGRPSMARSYASIICMLTWYYRFEDGDKEIFNRYLAKASKINSVDAAYARYRVWLSMDASPLKNYEPATVDGKVFHIMLQKNVDFLYDFEDRMKALGSIETLADGSVSFVPYDNPRPLPPARLTIAPPPPPPRQGNHDDGIFSMDDEVGEHAAQSHHQQLLEYNNNEDVHHSGGDLVSNFDMESTDNLDLEVIRHGQPSGEVRRKRPNSGTTKTGQPAKPRQRAPKNADGTSTTKKRARAPSTNGGGDGQEGAPVAKRRKASSNASRAQNDAAASSSASVHQHEMEDDSSMNYDDITRDNVVLPVTSSRNLQSMPRVARQPGFKQRNGYIADEDGGFRAVSLPEGATIVDNRIVYTNTSNSSSHTNADQVAPDAAQHHHEEQAQSSIAEQVSEEDNGLPRPDHEVTPFVSNEADEDQVIVDSLASDESHEIDMSSFDANAEISASTTTTTAAAANDEEENTLPVEETSIPVEEAPSIAPPEEEEEPAPRPVAAPKTRKASVKRVTKLPKRTRGK